MLNDVIVSKDIFICFVLKSKDEKSKIYKDKDSKDYDKIERYLELDSAERCGNALFFIKGINKFYNSNWDELTNLNGISVFPRCYVNDIKIITTNVLLAGGIPIVSNADISKIDNWFLYYPPIRKYGDVTKRNLPYNYDKYKNKAGLVFLKTKKKGSHEILYTPRSNLMVGGNRPLLISEYVELLSDEYGTLEYRTFVVCGKITSISRYNDILSLPIPSYIVDKVNIIVSKLSKTDFPSSYVLDVMEYLSDGLKVVDIVEINHIYASGRYIDNLL